MTRLHASSRASRSDVPTPTGTHRRSSLVSFALGVVTLTIPARFVLSCVPLERACLVRLPLSSARFALADRRTLPVLDPTRHLWASHVDPQARYALVVRAGARRVAILAGHVGTLADGVLGTPCDVARLECVHLPFGASDALVFAGESDA